jgi:NAD(P)-dependent dehydrogenase (short-subunit alcohol dehydrogenase family)
MKETSSIKGKTALVTGSSRNLGAEIARELARRGVRVGVNYASSQSEANDLVTELAGINDLDHRAFQANLANSTEVYALCADAQSEFGTIDILINNVGPFSMEPFTELDESEWDRVWDVNVKAAYLCVKSLASGMIEAGWGRIVNVSAGSAYIRNHSIYTLAKQALTTLTEGLALELGPSINVNAVAPGQIAESADDIADFDPTFVERAISWTPAGRLATRREVAYIVAELCDTPYDIVTGVTIPIDGGWRLNRF